MVKNNIQKTILENGLTIITEKIDYTSLISIGIFIKTGAINEDATNNGISHFIEHMVFKGTQKRNSFDITYEIESKGGYINAYTSKELTCYYIKILKNYWGNAFDILFDITQNPTFNEKEIKKESRVVIDEINDIKDTPEEYILDIFEENLYKNNNLKNAVLGKITNLKKFNQQQLNDYFNRYYVANNMVVALVGDVEHDKLVQKVYEYSFNFNVNNKDDRKSNSIDYKKFNITKEIDYQQTHVLIGKSLPGMLYEKRMALNIISTIIGEGSTSLLFQKLREEKGIAYQISSYINSYFDVSTFGIYFSTNQKKYKKAIDLIYDEISLLLKQKVDKKHFDRAKDYLIGTYLMQNENLTEKLFRLGNNEYYYNKIIPLNETIKQVELVTIDEVNDLLHFFDPETFSLLLLQ